MLRNAIGLAAVLLPAALAQHTVDLEGRYWLPEMNARLRVDQNGFGTDIDAKRDLGISKTDFAQGVVTLLSGRNRVKFGYTPIAYSADSDITRTLVFRGTEYLLGTRVVSDLEVKHLQASWAYQFIRAGDGRFRLGPMVEADGFLMRGSLNAPNLNLSQKENLSAGLPTVGAAMDINPHRRVNVYGEVAGMKVGDYGYFISSDAGVKVRVSHVLFSAGYRTFNLHVTTAPDFARLRLRGPFAGAGFTF